MTSKKPPPSDRPPYHVILSLRQKLHLAVENLATGKGSLKDRLYNVYVSYLLPVQLDENRSHIERLLADTQRLATSKRDPTGKLGTLKTTLSSSGWQTDQKIARKLFEAYELTTEAFYRHRRTLD